jgi:signal peptidase I
MYGILGAAVVLTAIVFAGLRTRWSPWLIAKIDGNSMHPALRHGERILVRRRDASSLRAGQIVLVSQPTLTEAGDWTWPPADSPVKQRKLMVKRIAKMRGQLVELLGDNVSASTDSREFGLADAEQIVGVYVRRLRLWRTASPEIPAAPTEPEAKYMSQRPFSLRTGSEEA